MFIDRVLQSGLPENMREGECEFSAAGEVVARLPGQLAEVFLALTYRDHKPAATIAFLAGC